jgi:hypothetical protein
MKALLILSLVLLVSCNGGPGVGPAASPTTAQPTASNPTNGINWNSRLDNNAQAISYDIAIGFMSYYSSTSHFADSDVWTIPEFINIDNDSLNAIQSDDYVELQIAGRTHCRYNKVTNYFQFQSCQTVNPAITWTMAAGDSYYQSDLNGNSIAMDKDKVIFVLKSGVMNRVMNGHITFSYDL